MTTVQICTIHVEIIALLQIVAKGSIPRKGSGATVNISSISGMLAVPGFPVYCTVKAAMDMLKKSIVLEFKPLKVNYCDC